MITSSVISGVVSSLLEIDEIEASKVKNKTRYTFVTTGIHPAFAEIKTKVWALLAPPVKRLKVLSVEPIEEGLITKRYKVKVEGESIGTALGKKKYRLLPLKTLRKR